MSFNLVSCCQGRDLANADTIVALLKAAGEETRLRLLALLAEGELSVKDFTEILGQSQPRISRHLKLLADAGLVTRHAEGAWAYYRLTESGVAGSLAGWLKDELDGSALDVARDRSKLTRLRMAQREKAAAYFGKIAESWDRLRSLHAPEAAVEQGILQCFEGSDVETLLDIGTGTGRMLELLADHYRQGMGIDSSREMLSIARAKLDAAGIVHAQVRLGDIAELEDYSDFADAVVVHQVLHYFDDPGAALGAIGACIKRNGSLVIVDFAPHKFEFLREEQAHRRLGLSDDQMESWAQAAGLKVVKVDKFPPQDSEGLTVCLWQLSPVGRTQ